MKLECCVWSDSEKSIFHFQFNQKSTSCITTDIALSLNPPSTIYWHYSTEKTKSHMPAYIQKSAWCIVIKCIEIIIHVPRKISFLIISYHLVILSSKNISDCLLYSLSDSLSLLQYSSLLSNQSLKTTWAQVKTDLWEITQIILTYHAKNSERSWWY